MSDTPPHHQPRNRAPEPSEHERADGFSIRDGDTVYRINSENGWKPMDTSGVQLYHAWCMDEQPYEKLLVTTHGPERYRLEYFTPRKPSGYSRDVQDFETAAQLADALEEFDFTVETYGTAGAVKE